MHSLRLKEVAKRSWGAMFGCPESDFPSALDNLQVSGLKAGFPQV